MVITKCLKECVTRATLEAYGNTFNISCATLKRMHYHQPITVSAGNCQESVWGVHPCDGQVFCGDTPLLIVAGGYITLLTILLVALCVMRHVCLKRELKKEGIRLRFKGCAVRSDRNGNIISDYKLWKYALFLLSGLQGVLSCAQVVTGGLMVTPGGTICTSKGNFTVPELIFDVSLNYEYETCDFMYYSTADWGCAGGSCPSVDDCDEMDVQIPRFEGDRFKRSFCVMYPNACAFGRGCRFGNKELKLFNFMRVYSVSAFRLPRHSITYLKGDCKMTEDRVNGLPEGSLTIIESEEETYLCPFYHNKGMAHAGMMGDIQIISKSEAVAFDWTSFHCGTEWFKNKHCPIPSSFVSNLNSYCCKFPCPYGNGVFLKRGPHVVYAQSDSQVVSFTCGNATIIQENATCSTPRIEMWGTRESGLGIYLSVQAESNNPHQDLIYEHPCLDGNLVIPCDGKIRFHPISEDTLCNFTDKTMWSLEASFMNNHHETTFSPLTHLLSESTPWWLHLIGGGWCLVLGIVLLVLILKR